MRYRCAHCGAGPFESHEARCPDCLRSSSVVPAGDAVRAAPTNRARPSKPPAAWVAIVVLIVLLSMTTMLGVFGAWDWSERRAARDWPTVDAAVTAYRPRRLSCDVQYRFRVGNERVDGMAHFFACPREGETVTVRYEPGAPSHQRAESWLDSFLDAFGVAIGLLGLVLFGAVLLHLLFPQVELFRQVAARLGSRHARERR